jgi:hypothetical protein
VNAPAAMRDLTAGTRIRHIKWETTGTVRISSGLTCARWDDCLAEDEISTEGPVFPCDVEILGHP